MLILSIKSSKLSVVAIIREAKQLKRKAAQFNTTVVKIGKNSS